MKVSVCTSVLNQSVFLKRMIESVRAQTLEDWELVIVDDGSTEDIQGLVTAYKDPRIKLHIFLENKGIPHGMNWALEHAEGEYVQPLSADEWIYEEKFKQQVEYLDTHKGTDCIWGIPGKQAQGFGLRPEWEQYILKAHNRSREAWIRTLLNMESIPIGGASMLMRRSALEDTGLFDPQFFHCSDLEWFVRFFQNHEGRVLPYRWADADQHEGMLTAPSEANTKRFQEDVKKLHEKHKILLPQTVGKVSIAMPVFNMAEFIGESIQCVLDQTYNDWELLIIDDCSTDDLAGALSKFSDPRIKLFKFDENRGTRVALNQALARAEGLYFVPFSSDDKIEPTFLERCVAEFMVQPFTEFVASQTDFITAEGKPFNDSSNVFATIEKASNKTQDQWKERLRHGNVYFGIGMYRTEVVQDLGGWNDFGCLMDYEMYLRLLHRENIKIIEENLTHTRNHGKNQSLLNKEEAAKLRKRYHDARVPFYQPRVKLIIATPFYEMRGFSPYISSMVHTCKILAMMGIDYEFWELSGDSYVDRAKNTLTNKFLEDPDATDLFIIDSDMQWNPAAVVNMISFPEEIVMGSYPQKNGWDKWTSIPKLVEEQGKHHPVGRMLPDGSALILADYISGGFIRMKRSCLEKYKEHYKEYTYYDQGADPTCPQRLYTEFYTCERRDNLRWGEDRVFGLRMRAIGIEGYIYPNIQFGHYGIKGWCGNYDTFLRDQTKAA